MKEYVRADGVVFKIGDEVEVTNPLAEPGTRPQPGYVGKITEIFINLGGLSRFGVYPPLAGACFAVDCFSHVNPIKKVNESMLTIQEFLKTKKHGVDYIINKNGLFEEPKKGEISEKK